MNEALSLEEVSLTPDGQPLTLSIICGEATAIVGPAASGKTQLLRVMAGLDRPARGSVRLRGDLSYAVRGSLSRRTRVQALARPEGSDAAISLLSALHLWDVRSEQVGDLSPSQVAACELVEPLTSRSAAVLIDGQLDLLDPWVLSDVQRLMRERESTAVLVATNRPDIAEWCGQLIVLKRRDVRFCGTVGELVARAGSREVIVSAQNHPAVEALVAPLDVEVRSEGDALVLQAPDEQELAVRLLREGYGNVRFLVQRQCTLAEALLTLVR